MKTLVKGLIGLQDMSLGGGTFTRSTSTGGVQTINQVPLSARSAIYIGEEFAASWGTSDIGAQFNLAYAALPAWGGRILITAKADGSPYQTSTPMLATTSGKYLLFEGMGTSNAITGASVATLPKGVVIQWTPVTGTALSAATRCLTLDYVPTGAAAWNGRHGVSNICFVNQDAAATNPLRLYGVSTAFPTPSTNTGIYVGTTNWGCLGAEFHNLDLRGFFYNFYVLNQISWGLSFYNLTSMFSTHGLHIQDIEQCTFINPKLLYNLTALETSSGIVIVGGSIDQNGGEFAASTNSTPTQSAAIVDIIGAAFTPDLTVVGTWFEQGQAGFKNPMQLIAFSNGISRVYGGKATDDLTTGTAQVWITAAFTVVDGLNCFSAGRTGTINQGTTQTFSRLYNGGTLSGGNPVLASSGGSGITDIGMQVNATPSASFGAAVTAVSGYAIAGTAASGKYLRGNGSLFVSATPSLVDNSDYATGTWTPVATSLANTGGAPTLTGSYTRVGKLVTFTIQIQPVTTTSATAGTTTFTLPPPGAPGAVGTAGSVTDLLTFSGSCVINSSSIFPTAWASKTNVIYVSGSYSLA